DTVSVYGNLTQTTMSFKNTLIDPETPAAVGSYFDGTCLKDLGGNITNQQPQFVDQPSGDYRLQPSSPAYTNATVLYSSSGLGFAYVDVDRNGAYNSGIDVIVDIIAGSGQYPPSASEYYYPRDMNGRIWLARRQYASSADLAGTMNMGAFASSWPSPMPRGTVFRIR
ncbi:MAG: hypothetical protein JXB13_04840, partial [Phycisphaerae bacterium]|nr:hypothetical protein [Phycisphaerae bacterium]